MNKFGMHMCTCVLTVGGISNGMEQRSFFKHTYQSPWACTAARNNELQLLDSQTSSYARRAYPNGDFKRLVQLCIEYTYQQKMNSILRYQQ